VRRRQFEKQRPQIATGATGWSPFDSKRRKLVMQSPESKRMRRLTHLWPFFLPLYFLAAPAFDQSEVTNAE
jgi:hypothetical protein